MSPYLQSKRSDIVLVKADMMRSKFVGFDDLSSFLRKLELYKNALDIPRLRETAIFRLSNSIVSLPAKLIKENSVHIKALLEEVGLDKLIQQFQSESSAKLRHVNSLICLQEYYLLTGNNLSRILNNDSGVIHDILQL